MTFEIASFWDQGLSKKAGVLGCVLEDSCHWTFFACTFNNATCKIIYMDPKGGEMEKNRLAKFKDNWTKFMCDWSAWYLHTNLKI